MWIKYNPNPKHKSVGDCAVRAIAKATGQDWESAYCALSACGYNLCDLPNANHVWGAYLRRCGFKRQIMDDSCPDCYTVEEFCNDHPRGVYVLSLNNHVVCVEDGCVYDSWDSTDEIVLYYWEKEV